MIDLLVINTPSIHHWLIVSTALFSVGLYGFLSSSNVIRILISMELILNAVAVKVIIFNYFISPEAVDGQVMSLFIIAVAAAEAVVGMGIFVALFRSRQTLDVTQLNTMKG